MKRIPLTQGKTATVSDRDYWLVRQFKWHAALNQKGGNWYACTAVGFPQKKFTMHRLIAGFPPFDLDHRNGRGLDNRRPNLRPATQMENNGNRRREKGNMSGFKGVFPCRRGQPWGAMIRQDGRGIWLGAYSTPEEAHIIYCFAAHFFFGEFARGE